MCDRACGDSENQRLHLHKEASSYLWFGWLQIHLVTGKICCCFVDVLTHLMYFKRKQTTNWFACPNKSSWHICRGRLGWRMSRSSLIRLLWSLVCFIVCMKKSVLYCHQVFWASDEVSYGIVVTHRATLYEQHVRGNLPNHETWACLILIKTTLHKTYLNGILMTQTVIENIPFSAQEARCAVFKLQ